MKSEAATPRHSGAAARPGENNGYCVARGASRGWRSSLWRLINCYISLGGNRLLATITILLVATVAAAVYLLRPKASKSAAAGQRVVYGAVADKPTAFGYRMAWLAIRTRDTARVHQALGLTDIKVSNWALGIGTAYDETLGANQVFVAPPLNGWTFVVGLALPCPMGRTFVDKCTPLLLDLGREFIEVQFFYTFPLVDTYAWARVIDGKLVRAFAVGEDGIIWNKGKPTKDEKSLGLKLFELRGVRGRKGDAGGELILHPTEEHVMKLAMRWSLDPTMIDKTDYPPALGHVGVASANWHAERLRKTA
jgi:hypothetical protein